MDFLEIVKVIIIGIIQGITEWLPVSSTGHMILADQFIRLNVTSAFKEMFLVVVQFGSIMAVAVLYWKRLFNIKKETLTMWLKIFVSCLPAAIIGVLFDDKLNQLFYNYQTVAVMLILFGIIFIVVENRNKNTVPKINSIAQITYSAALIIGVFQLIAAAFPGTSRSGATIIGALILGVSRTTATEYTFFLAVPVMFGASALKLVKFGSVFTTAEVITLLTGMAVAFIVSIIAIRFLTGYIKKHDFKAFGWYRIVLGVFVLAYFLFIA